MDAQKKEKLESFFKDDSNFKEQLLPLRNLLTSLEFQETLKWGMPTYTINGKNVVGICAFKQHYGLWFFQGKFLKDNFKLLRNAQEGKTRGMRQLIFTEDDVLPIDIIREYALEAIQNQKDGKKIKITRTAVSKKIIIPQELTDAFIKNDALEKSFKTLTQGKQREYAEHIASAKQTKTRLSRLEKAVPQILDGKGLHDKYK